MTTSDTAEKGLESLIVEALTGTREVAPEGGVRVAEPRAPYGGSGYVLGDSKDYDRDHAVDLVKLLEFLQTTQPDAF